MSRATPADFLNHDIGFKHASPVGTAFNVALALLKP
jgi:hypothetical protein